MTKTMFLLSALIVAASTSPILARGGQFGGPIGPGSRDGLQPSVNDYRPENRSNAFANEPLRPITKMRSRKAKRR